MSQHEREQEWTRADLHARPQPPVPVDYAAEKDMLARLIDAHAPHGFAGVMRAPDDGCPVYVAAVALFDALAGPSPAALDRTGASE